jgi:hypothetical protein
MMNKYSTDASKPIVAENMCDFLILFNKCINCHRFVTIYLKAFHSYMFRTLSVRDNADPIT